MTLTRLRYIAASAVVGLGLATTTVAAPPDPAIAGEWVAFCSIELPAGQSAEAKEAWRSAIGSLLNNAANSVLPAGSAGFKTIADAVAEVVEGKPVALWLTAAESGVVVTTHVKLSGASAPASVSAAAGEWKAHRAKVDASHPGLAPSFEFAINLNTSRHQFPDAFDRAEGREGRGIRMLESLSLPNARVVGVHVRLIKPESVKTRDPSLPRSASAEAPYAGPMLAVVDATWTARNERPGYVYLLPMTTTYWPNSQIGGDPPAASIIAAAVRTSWKPLLQRALALYADCLPAAAVPDYLRDMRAWLKDHHTAVERMTLTLDPWVGLGLSQSQPTSLAVVTHLRADSAPEPSAAAMTEILGPFCEGGKAGGGSDQWSWTLMPRQNAWWLRAGIWNLRAAKAPARPEITGTVRIEKTGGP